MTGEVAFIVLLFGLVGGFVWWVVWLSRQPIPEIPFGWCLTCGFPKGRHSQDGHCYFGWARTERWNPKPTPEEG